MTSTADLAVIGSGSLSRAVCCSLAVAASHPLRVTVHARSPQKADEVVYLAQARARLSGTPARFEARPLGAEDARVVLVCASEQSPWERRGAPSAWTELMRAAGFGITLALQASLALEAARRHPAVVNACFPDAVNPLLKACGAPVLCGIGNVAILQASLAAALDVEPSRLRVLAHHVHLHEPHDPHDEARAWLDGTPVPGITKAVAAQRASDPAQVNLVTGHSAALFLLRLLAGEEQTVSVPGPLGLPGGYPVTIGKEAALDLPPGVSEAEAIAFNQRIAEADGVIVTDGAVTFSAKAREALEPHAPELAAGFAPGDLPGVIARFRELRDQLRQKEGRR